MTRPTQTNRRRLLAAMMAAGSTQLLPVRAASTVKGRSDVIVIGAGLAGLNAALHMQDHGLQVLVLESRDRVGGRVHTLDDVPGAPEAGGNIAGPMYARFLALARRLGLTLATARARESSEYSDPAAVAALHLRGATIALDEWATHPVNPFAEPLRAVLPWRFRSAALAELNPLTELNDWLQPGYERYDISVAAALRQAGISNAAISLGVAENQGYGTAPDTISALHLHQVATWGKYQGLGKGIYRIAGGNQRLPEAMAAALQQPVRTEQAVVAIHKNGAGVEVETSKGERISASAAVVAVPLSVLRKIRFEPGLPALHAQAARQIPYSTTTQVLCAVEQPYWERDGLPPNLWTDLPFGELMAYPYGPNGEVGSAAFWMMGSDALRADQLSDQALIAQCMSTLRSVRPAAAAALRPLKVLSWQRDPNSAGTWISWGPGHISRYARHIGKPHGAIHFAGEHTAQLERGMEGALESGERAALEVLTRLG